MPANSSFPHSVFRFRRLSAAALAAGVALTLSACGSNDDATGSTPGAAGSSSSNSAPSTAGSGVAAVHNDADVTFINDMTPHHSSAIEMAQMAATRASSPAVKDLASKIAAAQGPEQDKMKAMAAAWGVPAPSTDPAMAGHDMSSMDSSAMPSASPSGMDMGMTMDMSQLEALSGTAFDKQFLTMMTEHHQSALPMAQAEISSGSNPQAKQLAQEIVTAQTAEISQMQQMLTTL